MYIYIYIYTHITTHTQGCVDVYIYTYLNTISRVGLFGCECMNTQCKLVARMCLA